MDTRIDSSPTAVIRSATTTILLLQHFWLLSIGLLLIGLGTAGCQKERVHRVDRAQSAEREDPLRGNE
jgi:hypothetical protein